MSAIALQRSKKWLEKRGWHCWITEHFNPWARIRQDAFGLFDLMSIRHDSNGVFGINACEDDGEVKAHVDRYLNGYVDIRKGRTYGPNNHLPVWLAAGNRFSIMGWGKRGAQGKRKTWTLRMVEFSLDGPQVIWKEVTQEPVEVEN